MCLSVYYRNSFFIIVAKIVIIVPDTWGIITALFLILSKTLNVSPSLSLRKTSPSKDGHDHYY
jgi:hypothetical protein